MLTVHHLGVSQSERIVWLCEELGIPYELKVYDREPDTRMAPASYKALHPVGSAPIITDGDVVLPESGAIMEYIIGKYGNGRLAVGPDQPNYADYLFWFHYANGSFMPSQMFALLLAMQGGAESPMTKRFLQERTERAWTLVEQRLGQVPYFAGNEFTAADVIMVFSLTTMRAFTGRKLDDLPNTRAYLKRVGERPAYRRAMKKGDPGMAPMLA
ncbi:MAG: glutathione S-transferase family protein [Caulobacteraceae bacterium]|nr:glutathione S-transferase family protein [Caulobacteraceae bacterium]